MMEEAASAVSFFWFGKLGFIGDKPPAKECGG